MEPVASCQNVKIYCPRDGRYSFFNSPYPAHNAYAAIDLYIKRAVGEAAPSPVRGEVMKIRRVMCPDGRYFESSRFDYVILIKSLENPRIVTKILHVAPVVEVGEAVEPGQDLGVLIRSGYFNFWTDPHIHVEVRKVSDPLRARGSFQLERLTKIDETEPLKELKGTVVEVKPEYSLVSLNDTIKEGTIADVGGHAGLLDAGIPHYGWVGIHTNSMPHVGETVKLCDRAIGIVETTNHNMCLARCVKFEFRLGTSKVGLSLYFHLSSKPLMKIVPPKPGALKTKKSEEVFIEII